MAKKAPGIMLYYEIRSALEHLSLDEKGRLLDAMLNYGEYGEAPDFADPTLAVTWSFISMRIDADHKRYQDKCERAAENAKKRWEKENEAMRTHADDANTTTTSTSASTSALSTKSTASSTAASTSASKSVSASAATAPAESTIVEKPVENYSPRSPEEFEALRQKALSRLTQGLGGGALSSRSGLRAGHSP